MAKKAGARWSPIVRNGLVGLVVLLGGIWIANRVLLSSSFAPPAPGVLMNNSLHVWCRHPAQRTSNTLVVFHHGETGHSLQFASVADELLAQGFVTCSYDWPGYGWSGQASGQVKPKELWTMILQASQASDEQHKFDSSVHVGQGVGCLRAWKAANVAGNSSRVVLVEMISPDAVEERAFAVEWREYLNRGIDNDYILALTGFARLLRQFGLWGPWYGGRYARHSASLARLEAHVELLPSHVQRIRNELLFSLWATLKKTKLKRFKGKRCDLLFAPTHVGSNAHFALLRARAKNYVLGVAQEDLVHFATLPKGTHESVILESAKEIAAEIARK